MMKVFLTLFVVTALTTGCTKCTSGSAGCAVEESAATLISSAVAAQLSCSNAEAIKTDIKAQIDKLNMCKATDAAKSQVASVKAEGQVSDQGAVGAIVCGPIIDALMAGALKAIPAAWGCTGGTGATDALKAALLSACTKAI